MAINGSGLFVSTIIDIFDDTQLGVDLSSETQLKAALYPGTITPNYDAAAASAAYGAGVFSGTEITGTGYTAGGVTVTSTTVTGSSGVLTFDAADLSWASSTLSGVRGVLIYADGLAGKNAIILVDLGASYSTSNGTLAVTWAAGGIFTLDLVP
ncbi:hypothetical protein [Microbispora sp. GKU 823]|uniref:hypothetical protein n=1 Tax=Microbispora sp. GKU 823 TaxID=1652100 RepID=UPI0009A30F45|nr:hypothetical protein [Microbispora sp. GKU 823]OPG13640.1 hypothetical protein B1L11_06545 [Microbispora sp. GKU 823]